MRKYPWIVVTPIETPLPTEIPVEEYGHFYRMPFAPLRISVWGFVDEEGANKFIPLGSYHSEPFHA